MFDDGYRNIFIGVIVVLNYDLLTDEYVALNMDIVLTRYNRVISNVTAIFNHDGGRTSRILSSDIQPYVIQQTHRITKADSARPLSTEPTREMK
ncbi:MAG TPA: hypothetical protein VFA90_05910 [Terriglobales bacterium]|nr:hypothetical protein [Terriglobales bacterium]